MTKIIYLTDYALNTIGGSQKSTITTIKQMHKIGYEIALITPKADGNKNKVFKELNKVCTIFEYRNRTDENKFSYYKYKLKFIKDIIMKYKPEIIHAQNIQSSIFVGLLKKFKQIDNKIKFIYTDRGFYDDYINKHKLLFKYISKNFDLLITTTNANKIAWSKAVNKNKITCVANILDEDWYQYSKKIEDKIKKEYKINNKLVIGFSGRYIDYKRWDTVKAICQRFKNNDNIKFMFAMTADTDSLRSQMNNYLKEIKEMLSDKVIILIDADVDKMKEFYYAIDIFVLTSDGESFGRTLIEAMTKMTIVFGTNSGGVPDVIQNKKYLFEVNDVDCITKKISKYFENKNLLDKEKKYFWEFVNKEYSLENFTIKMDGVYKNVQKH